MYDLEGGEVLVKTCHYQIHRGSRNEIIHIDVIECIAGITADTPRFIACPMDHPYTFRKARPEFTVEAETEAEVVQKCLQKLKGIPETEVFIKKE